MADSHSPQPTNAPATKGRNPVERLIVWGLIGVLVVAVAIEFQSRRSHGNAISTLAEMVEAIDKDPKKPEVTEDDVKKVVGDKKPSRTEEFAIGKIPANGARRLEIYSWFTLNPGSKREMWVYYGAKGQNANEKAAVIEVQASEVMAEAPQAAASSAAANQGDPTLTGPGVPGMQGGGGGGSLPPMIGPRARRGGPGAGRPGAGSPTEGAAQADAANSDADKAAADKPDETTADDQAVADDSSSEKSDEKTNEDKTDEADQNNE